jgi:hypothetical protein
MKDLTQKSRCVADKRINLFRRITWFTGFYLLLPYSLGWGAQLSSQAQTFEVIEVASNRLVFALQPFELSVKPFPIENKSYDYVTIPDYGVTTEPGFPTLPGTGALIPLPSEGGVTVRVIESQFEEISGIDLPPAPYVQADPQSGQITYRYLQDEAIYTSDVFWPAKLAEISEKGRLRGRLIGRIQVYPVQYNPVRKTLRVYKTLKIQVDFSSPLPKKTTRGKSQPDLFDKLTQSLLLTSDLAFVPEKEPVTKSAMRPNAWYDPQFSYYKLFVDTTGIYALTYDDLLNAGVAVDFLDLSSLKIINQGRQIPIWIDGPQGVTFSPQNTIYFFGDRYRGPDSYYDMYTDTNVYWLTRMEKPASDIGWLRRPTHPLPARLSIGKGCTLKKKAFFIARMAPAPWMRARAGSGVIFSITIEKFLIFK